MMGPLSGIKILDFSQLHGAVFTTMLLADFGAEVIKVEHPDHGDLLRTYPPIEKGCSGYHAYLNRGKKSITVDISSPEGHDTIINLLKETDVVCENFRYGTMEKYGLGYRDLAKVKPNIIYAALTGYGRSGVLMEKACFENTAQAHSSMLDMSGEKDGPPVTMGAPFGNLYGGLHLAIGINMAMIHLRKTGEGQMIDVSCVDSLFTALEDGMVNCSIAGHKHERNGNQSIAICPYDTFKTLDGFVSIGVSTEQQWKKFCVAMGFEHIMRSPKYCTNDKRSLHYRGEGGLQKIIEEITSKKTKFEMEHLLSGVQIPCAAICQISEAIDNEQTKIREMMIEVDDEGIGKVKQPGIPAKLYATPGKAEKGAPALGSSNRQLQGGEI